MGKIAIYAEGEKLTGAKKQVGTEDYRFVYEEKPVEGAQFEIRAAEDIYSPEGGENRTLIFHSGEVAATMVTDEKGQAWPGPLPRHSSVNGAELSPAGNAIPASRP